MIWYVFIVFKKQVVKKVWMTSQFQEKLFFERITLFALQIMSLKYVAIEATLSEIPVQNLDGIVLVILKSPLMN